MLKESFFLLSFTRFWISKQSNLKCHFQSYRLPSLGKTNSHSKTVIITPNVYPRTEKRIVKLKVSFLVLSFTRSRKSQQSYLNCHFSSIVYPRSRKQMVRLKESFLLLSFTRAWIRKQVYLESHFYSYRLPAHTKANNHT